MRFKLFAAICLLLFFVAASHARSFKVALFSPKASSPFWTMLANLAKEAAADLGVELMVYDAELSQYKMKQQVQEAVSGPDKVDAIVISNFKQIAPQLIAIAEKEQVNIFLFNSGLTIKQQTELGKPREKFKFWIGEILPDDKDSAMILTNLLIDAVKKNNKTNSDIKVQMLALSGISSDVTSLNRVAGMNQSVASRNDVVLEQTVSTDYSAEDGEKKFNWLIRRYPKTNAVWSASYRITDGIIEGMRKQGLVPGKTIFTNSVVLNEKALDMVKSGELVATTGGHYIEGAWVMVMLYDYLSGVDFAGESLEMKTPMGIVTKDNVDLYLSKVTRQKLSPENLKKIDFTRYSKKINPELKNYDFNLASILKQL